MNIPSSIKGQVRSNRYLVIRLGQYSQNLRHGRRGVISEFCLNFRVIITLAIIRVVAVLILIFGNGLASLEGFP